MSKNSPKMPKICLPGQVGTRSQIVLPILTKNLDFLGKNPKSAVPDGKALSFARTQLGHHVSLLIGSDFIS